MSDKENPLGLRYSRAERLKRASPELRRMEEERGRRTKRGFFALVTGHRGMGLIMATIVAFVIFGVLLNSVSGGKAKALAGYAVQAQATRIASGISVELTIVQQDGISKLFSSFGKGQAGSILSVTASTDGMNFSRKEFSIAGKDAERFFFTLPGGSGSLSVNLIIGLGGKSLELSTRIEDQGP
jgi:hypothetical protein